MRAIRFRLDRLMIWVVVAAVNLAAFRALFATRNVIYLGVGMMTWIMIQVGIFRAFRNQGVKRPYWLGFATGGAIVAVSILSIGHEPTAIEELIWRPYLAVIETMFERSEPWLARLFGNGGLDEIVAALFYMIACLLPVILAALASGHLCRILFLRQNRLADPA